MRIFNSAKQIVTVAIIALISTGGFVSDANAATVTGTCEGGNKYVTLFSVEANDANNVHCQSGNPAYSGPVFEDTFFGETYTLAYKSIGTVGTGKEKGDDTVTFTSFTTGFWALSATPSAMLKIIVGIKQGTTYAGFLVNTQSGTWSTANNSTAQPNNGISHYDIWYQDQTAPVPLPAAGWMLLAGLGGLGAMRRRRKS